MLTQAQLLFLKAGYLLFFSVCLQSCFFVPKITISNIDNNISLIKVYPDYVNANGGDSIVITGTQLGAVKTITINSQPCLNLTHISDSEVSCITTTNHGLAVLADINLIGNRKTVNVKNALTYTLILGQPNSQGKDIYAARTFNLPFFAKSIGGKFFVSDTNYNRILIWNSNPSSPFVSPDLIIGQSDEFVTKLNAPISGSSLYSPKSVWSDGTKLVVVDHNNSRILIWNTFPKVNGQPADLVLGQPDFTSRIVNNGPNTPACDNVAGINSCSLDKPTDVLFVEDKFMVLDNGNNRLLIWDGWPTNIQQPADHVIGQPSFITSTSNNGMVSVGCGAAGRNACSLSDPQLFAYSNGKLIISDTGNNRILIFNNIPLSNGTPADLVLGQSTFTTSSSSGPATAPCGGIAGINACSLNSPYGIDTDGTSLFVADSSNNRVLGWSVFPTINQAPADIVLGQNSFYINTKNQGAAHPSDTSLNSPRSVQFFNNKLWVADSSNNRVLSFDTFANSSSAEMVLGHRIFSESEVGKFGAASNEVYRAVESLYNGAYSIIVDRMNHRVILESGMPKTLDDDSQRVTIGQPNSADGLSNNGPNSIACGGVAGLNACSLKEPMGAILVGNKIAVADYGNNRVLIWNSIPAYNQQPADLVLGQPSFTTNSTNNGPNTVACGGVSGRNSCSLSSPIGMASNGTNLIVADYLNRRVLIWNTFPTVNQAPADVVIGQPDFSSNGVNNGPNTAACDNVAGINRCSLNTPFYVKIHLGKMILTDNLNHRILIWNSIPTSNQAPADVVLGQDNFTTGTVSTSLFSKPRGVCLTDSGKLVVSDTENNRLLIYKQIPTTNNPPPDSVIGQDNFTDVSMYSGKDTNAGNFQFPYGVTCYQESVFISDYLSSRVIFFPLRPLP